MKKYEELLENAEAVRLFNLLKDSVKLSGIITSIMERGYTTTYPTRTDLFVACNNIREKIETLERSNDIIKRRHK